MIADIELGKFGGIVVRVPREEVTMNTVECAIDLQTFFSEPDARDEAVTHQECDIPILEEIYVVLYKRFVGCWVGGHRPVRELGSKLSRFYTSGSGGHRVWN